jgi:hypothetical protein
VRSATTSVGVRAAGHGRDGQSIHPLSGYTRIAPAGVTANLASDPASLPNRIVRASALRFLHFF